MEKIFLNSADVGNEGFWDNRWSGLYNEMFL